MRLCEGFDRLVVGPQIIGAVIELVDPAGECHLQLIIRDPAAAVQDQSEAFRRRVDRVQAVDVQVRDTLIESVRVPDRDREKVYPGLLVELLCRLRLCIKVKVRTGILSRKADMADLALDRDTPCVHLVRDHLRLCRVLLQGKLGAVKHDGSEPGIRGAADLLICIAVVQMQADRHFHFRGKLFCDGGKALEVDGMPLSRMSRKQLDQDRRRCLLRRPDHAGDGVVIKAVDTEHGRVRLLRAPDDIDTFFKCHLVFFLSCLFFVVCSLLKNAWGRLPQTFRKTYSLLLFSRLGLTLTYHVRVNSDEDDNALNNILPVDIQVHQGQTV